MSSRVEGYATALFEVARAEEAVDKVGSDLFHFARALERSDELRSALSDQNLPPEKRQAIVEDLLSNKALPFSAALVAFVVAAGRARLLVEIIDTFIEKAAAEGGKEVAEVISAIPLNDEQQDRLAEALSKALRKIVEVRVVVDPEVMGGLVAKVGDTVIDGSVRHRLDQLREAM